MSNRLFDFLNRKLRELLPQYEGYNSSLQYHSLRLGTQALRMNGQHEELLRNKKEIESLGRRVTELERKFRDRNYFGGN